MRAAAATKTPSLLFPEKGHAMPTARINGIDLYYEIHGEGPAVLLSHGVGSNHLHWWQQVPEFRKRYKTIVFDHRGFGFSTDDGRGPGGFVDDLEGLLDKLNIESVALVGQSMGGFTVCGLATRYPQRVTALVLSCSSGGMVAAQHSPAVRHALQTAENYEQFAKMSLQQDHFEQRHPELYFLFEQMSQLNRSVNVKLLSRLRDLQHDISQVAQKPIPTLLLGGEEDAGMNAALAEMHGRIPGSELDIFQGAGHLLFFEEAERYNRRVLGFLDRHLQR